MSLLLSDSFVGVNTKNRLCGKTGTGGRNRTLVVGFGDRCSTIELHRCGVAGRSRTDIRRSCNPPPNLSVHGHVYPVGYKTRIYPVGYKDGGSGGDRTLGTLRSYAVARRCITTLPHFRLSSPSGCPARNRTPISRTKTKRLTISRTGKTLCMFSRSAHETSLSCAYRLDARGGVEPPFPGSEPGVLPLDDQATIWSRRRESNPHLRDHNPACYHYTTPSIWTGANGRI